MQAQDIVKKYIGKSIVAISNMFLCLYHIYLLL